MSRASSIFASWKISVSASSLTSCILSSRDSPDTVDSFSMVAVSSASRRPPGTLTKRDFGFVSNGGIVCCLVIITEELGEDVCVSTTLV